MVTVTKKKASRERLDRDKYFSLIEHAADGIAIIQDGVFKLVNTALSGICGYDKEELLSMPFVKLLTTESQKLTMTRYQARMAGKKVPAVYEVQAVTKTGEIRDIELNAVLTEYEGRTADEVIIRDISERKRTEAALRESEEEKNTIIEEAPVGICHTDLKGTIKYVNKRFEEESGYSREDIVGKNAFKLDWFPEGTQRHFMQRMAARMRGKPHKYWETQFKRKDGTWIWVTTEGKVIKKLGVPVGFQILASDITKRKQAAEALRESEEKYKTLVEDAPIGIYFNDFGGTLLYGNKKAEEITGFKREELLGQSFLKLKLLDPKEMAKATKLLALNKLGKATGPNRFVLKRQDGTKSIVEIHTRITTVGGKKLVLGMVEDITERKKAEQALQQSEQSYRDLYELAPYGVVTTDRKGFVTSCNAATMRVIGYHEDEIVGKHFTKLPFLHLSELPRYIKIYNSLLRGKVPAPTEINLRAKDGTSCWLEAHFGLLGKDGSKKGFQLAFEDITERKKAEEALADEATRRHILIDQSRDGIVVLDQDGKVYEANKRFAEMLGYTPEETAELGVWDWEAVVPRQQVLEMIRTVDEAGDHFETRHRRKDGTFYDVEISTNGAMFAGQKLIFCVCRDITERKKAERTLEESQKFSNSLLESSANPILVINPDTSVKYINPAFKKLTGFIPSETVGRKAPYPWWPERKRQEITAAFNDAIAHGGRRTERNFKKKNGERFWAAVNSAPVMHQGKPVYFILNWADITERKRIEERLRLAESAVKASVSAIGITDLKGNLIYVNPAHADIFGYDSPEEMLGKNVTSLFKEADEIRNGIETARATGGSIMTEAVLKRKDGTEFVAEIRASTIMDAQGKPMGLTASIIDITERKRAEEALRESEERYRAVIEGAHDMIQSAALDGSINFVNQAWLDTLGYTKADLPKLNLFKIIHPDSLPHCQEMFGKVIKGEAVHNVEATFVTKDGRQILVEGNATPRIIGDKVVATQGIFRDVTERTQMEAKIRVFSNAIAGAVDAITITDTQGIITYANSAMEKTYGYEEGELLGKSVTILNANPENANELMTEMIKKGSWKGEIEAIKKNKEPFPASLSLSTVRDNKGNIMAMMGALRDITERKEMEQQLQEKNEQLDAQNEELRAINEELRVTEDELQHSQERLERMFESVTDGIVVTTLDGTVLKVNKRAAQMIGYTSDDELMGKSCFDCVVPSDHQKMSNNMKRVVKDGLIISQEYTLHRADGTEFPAELSTNVIKDATGKAIGLITIARDITERRQTEEREKQLQQELNLAGRLASIGQLAAGVAHEINNPLTGVIGFSHLMLSRDIPEDIKQDLQVIHSEAQRVAKIVENLLVFAHQRKTGREYVNINEIINRVLELRAYEMKVNNIEVEAQLAPELPLTIADAGQLQQVFLNIVLNAEHFMTKAHNRGRLLVKTEKVDSNIRASFTDNGTGINPENLDKIFNPFFTTKEVGKGTGLGLSICHSIITQHQGRIYAQSQPGKGATFVIELPIVAKPAQTDQAEETGKEPEKSQGAKILVVDDEKAILTFLSRLLTAWGHTVETINNADTALERLKTERYSLILLDIKLPGMSGIELYHHIEKTVPALTRRVMFITGDVMEGTTREFLEKSKAAHITKPLDIDALKKMINRALNQTHPAPVT